MEKLRKSNCISLDFDLLRWIFLVYINLVFVEKENEVINGIYEDGRNGSVDGLEDISIDVFKGSNFVKDEGMVNGNVGEEDGSVFEDDDEGLIVCLKKWWRSNIFFDSGLEKFEVWLVENEGVSLKKDDSEKEGLVFNVIANEGNMLNNVVELEVVVVKKCMKLNDEELKEDVSEDFVDNLYLEDFLFLLFFLFLFLLEDSDNGEVMEDN